MPDGRADVLKKEVGELTKERWMDIGAWYGAAPERDRRIVSQAGMDIVSIAATDGGRIWATYIDDDDGKQYTIEHQAGRDNGTVNRQKSSLRRTEKSTLAGRQASGAQEI